MRQDAGKWIQRNKKAVTEDSVTAFLCKKLLNMLTSIHSSFIYFCKRNLACSGCRCHVLIFRLIFPNAIAGTDFYRNFAIGCADFLELCIQGSAVAGLDTGTVPSWCDFLKWLLRFIYDCFACMYICRRMSDPL